MTARGAWPSSCTTQHRAPGAAGTPNPPSCTSAEPRAASAPPASRRVPRSPPGCSHPAPPYVTAARLGSVSMLEGDGEVLFGGDGLTGGPIDVPCCSSLRAICAASGHRSGGGRPMLPGRVARRWPGLCNPTEGAGISSRTLRALVSRPAACAAVALGMALLNAAARRQAGLLLTHLQPGEGRNRGLRLAAHNNDAKSKEFPKSSSRFHPQLGRRTGTGMGMEEAPRKSPPVSAPSSAAALPQRHPCRAAGPRPAPSPSARSCCPQCPSVRPSVRQLNQSRHREHRSGPRKCPWGRSQPGSPRTPGCWAPGDTAGPAEPPPTPRLGAAAPEVPQGSG